MCAKLLPILFGLRPRVRTYDLTIVLGDFNINMRALLFVATIIVLSFLDKQTNVGGVRLYRSNYQLDPGIMSR
jgi:hypothetical protein